MEDTISDNEIANVLFKECLDYLNNANETVNNDLTETLNDDLVKNVGQRTNYLISLLHQDNPDQIENNEGRLVEKGSKTEMDSKNSKESINIMKDGKYGPATVMDAFKLKEDPLKLENDEEAYEEIGLEANRTLLPIKVKATYQILNELHEKAHSDSDLLNTRDAYESFGESRSERIRKLSRQLPKIIITPSDGCPAAETRVLYEKTPQKWVKVPYVRPNPRRSYSRRRVTKVGEENVALIKNIPFEKMRLLSDTFHTLINLRWRWIVLGTVLVHFAIWFVFAVFWYIAALAHYDFEPDPPERRCITGGTDFLNIFLASVEAQHYVARCTADPNLDESMKTTIGFGDRTIDEECPESIFLFIMQLIMGTGLSGVLTCVVYAKLTRPENFAKQGVGFSRKAVVSLRDGQLCLIFRAWDLNHDHIIGSTVSVYLIRSGRTKEGEVLKHYAESLELRQRQLMLWPVTVAHVLDRRSPLYELAPEDFMNERYEIVVSLKGASASLGTYTQSQTSYLPREVMWGYRFPPVVSYNHHEQMYVIDHKNLDTVEEVATPLCSARRLAIAHLPAPACTPGSATPEGSTPGRSTPGRSTPGRCTPPLTTPGDCTLGFSTLSRFSEKLDTFERGRTSSFRRKNELNAYNF